MTSDEDIQALRDSALRTAVERGWFTRPNPAMDAAEALWRKLRDRHDDTMVRQGLTMTDLWGEFI